MVSVFPEVELSLTILDSEIFFSDYSHLSVAIFNTSELKNR
jgi:hypothetical protein